MYVAMWDNLQHTLLGEKKARCRIVSTMCYHLYIKRRTSVKHIIECICINYLWKETQEAGNHNYFWERKGEVGGWGNGTERETTVYPFRSFENCIMWMYYLFNK